MSSSSLPSTDSFSSERFAREAVEHPTSSGESKGSFISLSPSTETKMVDHGTVNLANAKTTPSAFHKYDNVDVSSSSYCNTSTHRLNMPIDGASNCDMYDPSNTISQTFNKVSCKAMESTEKRRFNDKDMMEVSQSVDVDCNTHSNRYLGHGAVDNLAHASPVTAKASSAESSESVNVQAMQLDADVMETVPSSTNQCNDRPGAIGMQKSDLKDQNVSSANQCNTATSTSERILFITEECVYCGKTKTIQYVSIHSLWCQQSKAPHRDHCSSSVCLSRFAFVCAMCII